MNKITVFSQTGSQSSASLPESLAMDANMSLISQAVHVYRDRQHPGTKDTKTRAEVNITKKKIYKQKGTGGARHGASSAPIFVGGGVTHGPKPNKRILNLPQAMKQKAFKGALSLKASDNKVVAFKGLNEITKTKEAASALKLITTELKVSGKTLIVLPNESTALRFYRNLARVKVSRVNQLNALDIFTSSLIVLDASLVKAESGASPKAKKEVTSKAKTKGVKKS